MVLVDWQLRIQPPALFAAVMKKARREARSRWMPQPCDSEPLRSTVDALRQHSLLVCCFSDLHDSADHTNLIQATLFESQHTIL